MIQSNKIKIYNAENRIRFNQPVVVEFYPGEVENKNYVIHFTYDFGMSDSVSFTVGTGFSGIMSEMSDEDVVRTSVEFDLNYTFNHYQGDPNYNHTHWALYGNLKDRIKI